MHSSPQPSPSAPYRDSEKQGQFAAPLAMIRTWRMQCNALTDAAYHHKNDLDPAIIRAMDQISECLIQAGDDLAAVAMERGESMGGYE